MNIWRSTSRSSHNEAEPNGADASLPATTKDLAAAASVTASSAWLSGHLNHLTAEQQQKLVDFKQLCAAKGYYSPGAADGRASHDDATMLRFLRARRFDVDASFVQFRDTEDWRRDNNIEALYENIDVESYEASRRMYPQWTGRRDHRGIPVYVFEIRHLTSKNMAAYNATVASANLPQNVSTAASVPPRMLRLFALYENLLRFVMPLCSALPRPHLETPIVSSNNIVDVSGVGLKQFWNLKGHMQDASVLATAHYPETLDRIFIIGAPSFFPTVWNWIKRWFDPVTTSKIFILSAAEVKPTLEAFMPPSSFPTQYGGELRWAWGDLPNLDEPARSLVGALFDDCGEPPLRGPVRFHGDSIEILGVENGKPRRRCIPVPSANRPAGAGAGNDNTEKPQAPVDQASATDSQAAAAVATEHDQPPTEQLQVPCAADEQPQVPFAADEQPNTQSQVAEKLPNGDANEQKSHE